MCIDRRMDQVNMVHIHTKSCQMDFLSYSTYMWILKKTNKQRGHRLLNKENRLVVGIGEGSGIMDERGEGGRSGENA